MTHVGAGGQVLDDGASGQNQVLEGLDRSWEGADYVHDRDPFQGQASLVRFII
jgi:hypothetical protein